MLFVKFSFFLQDSLEDLQEAQAAEAAIKPSAGDPHDQVDILDKRLQRETQSSCKILTLEVYRVAENIKPLQMMNPFFKGFS